MTEPHIELLTQLGAAQTWPDWAVPVVAFAGALLILAWCCLMTHRIPK